MYQHLCLTRGCSGVVNGRQRWSAFISCLVVVERKQFAIAAAARRRLLRDGLAQAVPERLQEVERERRPAQVGDRPADDARRVECTGCGRNSFELGRLCAARRLHKRTGAQHAVY